MKRPSSPRLPAPAVPRARPHGVSWSALEALYQVVHAGGFRAAAELFGTSASALHQQLTRLEEALDYAVLDRSNPQKIAATRAGEILYRYIAPFFEGLGPIIDRAGGKSQRMLHIGATQAILQNRLAEPLRRYHRREPEVEIRIVERPWLEIVDLVTRGKVDLGFAPAPPPGHDLSYDPIYESEYQLICPPGHPLLRAPAVTLDALAREPLILFPPETATGRIIWARFESAGIPFRPYCMTDNVGTIQHFVAGGLGVAIVSGISVGPARGRPFKVRPVGALFGSISQGVMWRRFWIFRAAVRSFLELLPRGQLIEQKLVQGS